MADKIRKKNKTNRSALPPVIRSRKTGFGLRVLTLLFLLFLTPSISHAVTAEEFYRQALEQNWIHPFAATCQSAHETGFWTSPLWQKSHNGAGIKADKAWIKSGRPTIKHVSPESVRGVMVYKASYFRSYNSISDFLYDYSKKIYKDYPLAAMNHDTMWGYFAALKRGRRGSWATTSKYFEYMVDKAVRLAPQLLGIQWRTQLLTEYNEAMARGLLTPEENEIVLKRLRAAGF